MAAPAGAWTAEAIVPAIEPDDRYRDIARREATDVPSSRCRLCDRHVRASPATKALVRTAAPGRSGLGEGDSRRAPKGTDMLTSAFAKHSCATPAAAAYPGPEDRRLLAVCSKRPVRGDAGKRAAASSGLTLGVCAYGRAAIAVAQPLVDRGNAIRLSKGRCRTLPGCLNAPRLGRRGSPRPGCIRSCARGRR
jgi:hypothetical protein